MFKQEEIKPYSNEGKKVTQVEAMFDNIAPTYDTLNHRLSWDIDKYWRNRAIKELKKVQPQRILDIATGTGDFAILAAEGLRPVLRGSASELNITTGTGDFATLAAEGLRPVLRGSASELNITGADISEGMMTIGREKVKAKGLEKVISFEKQDCSALSYPADTFDAVMAAFGIRNFQDLKQGLSEMCRVLKPGGLFCVLELTTPKHAPMRQLFQLYSSTILPLYGRLISHDTAAYSYLNKTIAAFPQGEEMMDILHGVGFSEATFHRLTFGICTLYIAKK